MLGGGLSEIQMLGGGLSEMQMLGGGLSGPFPAPDGQHTFQSSHQQKGKRPHTLTFRRTFINTQKSPRANYEDA